MNEPDQTKIRRRDILTQVAGAIPVTAVFELAVNASAEGGERMFGQIAKIAAIPGKRDELVATLLEGSRDMPGCLIYLVANDTSEADAIWISEVWKDKESHEASLSLPSVKRALSQGRPLIASFSIRASMTPIGGIGLSRAVR